MDKTELVARPLNLKIDNLMAESLFIGNGNLALEVAVFNSNLKPKKNTLLQAYKERKNSRAAPVLVVVHYPDGISICGTNGDQPPIISSEDKRQVERLCVGALSKPDRNSAIRLLSSAIPSLETELPGILNEGLLSTHELVTGTKNRGDWFSATEKSDNVVTKTDRELVKALGYETTPIDNLTELLSVGDERTALAVLLQEDETPEIGAQRFNNFSPVSYALTKADKERLKWVLMVQGDRIRLYSTENIGVGRRGRTETYLECQLSILSSVNQGLAWLLFSSDALKKNGTIEEILEQSKRFASDIADELRERIYVTVIPKLSMGIARERLSGVFGKDQLAFTYEMALTVLFRLLFIAYAEDRDLLPFKSNESYKKRSLKQKADELSKTNSTDPTGYHHWTEATILWNAIYNGNVEWGVPSYNGTIFSSDEAISKVGSELAAIKLENRYFEEALKGLLLSKTKDGNYAPIDFRSLSVREFGTIYEGLLESELSQAQADLAVDNKGTYFPASKNDKVEISSGEIYLHDRSGSRKTTGSFYTPDFAVEHLLEGSLEPAIDKHLSRLEKMGEAERAENFFNFKIADIAMGSGHFLVAAIDRIERRLAFWLDENPTPAIFRNLQLLRESAKKQLGELSETVVIEDGQLLRRMIARKCIYGVDLNQITVQLARLSIWIHTFVPGLPLSLLDHNLIHGNSLIGVGSLSEIRDKFDSAKDTLFQVDADNLLGQASEPLKKLAKISDASIKDIEYARSLIEETRVKTLETKALCDIITAQPLSKDPKLIGFQFEDWSRMKNNIQSSIEIKLAKEILARVKPVHFPISFPEVFLGRSQGFDVIVGNPPWEEAVVNEDKFWARHSPGLSSLSPREQEEKKEGLSESRPDLVKELEAEIIEASLVRDFLHTGNFPGMGTGDPDLYKAFAWRFWFISSQDNGRIGVVLPRSALAALGSEQFRRELFKIAPSLDIVTLQNTGRWVFDIHPQYSIALINISKSKESAEGISLKGPYTSMNDFMSNKDLDSHRFNSGEVLSWNNSVSLPLLPTHLSPEIFSQLKKAPWLSKDDPSSWRVRPDRELDATNQKNLMDFSTECPDGFWKVYKGASFDLWNPDTGEYNAWADPKVVLPWIQQKRLKANQGTRDSVHKEFSEEFVKDEKTLPPLEPRIAFRDISRSSDTRTVRSALIPPNTFITNTGPVILFPRGDKKDEAYLLGILSSIPLDWYARRMVETHVNFFVLNPFPIPRPERTNVLWQKVVKIAGRLASVDERFSSWADDVGVEVGALDEVEKNEKIYELDALVSHLYGLSEDQVTHIFESFHEGWDYHERLNSVLSHYKHWKESLVDG